MNVLSPTTQRHVEVKLVKEGLITVPQLAQFKSEATKSGQPLLTFLIQQGHINDEQLTKTLAQVSKVPYVNLGEVRIDPKVLELLPQEVARQYMAVPLGEMQNRLVVGYSPGTGTIRPYPRTGRGFDVSRIGRDARRRNSAPRPGREKSPGPGTGFTYF